jgi:hypothetical protein
MGVLLYASSQWSVHAYINSVAPAAGGLGAKHFSDLGLV